MRKDQKRAELERFLDLVNLRLWPEPGGTGETVPPCDGLEGYTRLRLWLEEKAFPSPVDRRDRGGLTLKERVNIQARLEGCLSVIAGKVGELRRYADGEPVLDAEAEYTPQFGPPLGTRITVRVQASLNHEVVGVSDGSRLVRPTAGAVDRARFQLVVAAGGGPEDTVFFDFLRCLEGVPLGAVRRCKECGKWFAHFTRRERDCCSNRCASRRSHRESRAKTKQKKPDKYAGMLEASRRRATESYERRQKAKHGPNVRVRHRRPKEQ